MNSQVFIDFIIKQLLLNVLLMRCSLVEMEVKKQEIIQRKEKNLIGLIIGLLERKKIRKINEHISIIRRLGKLHFRAIRQLKHGNSEPLQNLLTGLGSSTNSVIFEIFGDANGPVRMGFCKDASLLKRRKCQS